MIIVPEPSHFQNREHECEQDSSMNTSAMASAILSDVLSADVCLYDQSPMSPDPCIRKRINHSRQRPHTRSVTFDLNLVREYSSQLQITDDDIGLLWHGNETRKQARAAVLALRSEASKARQDEEPTTNSYVDHFKQALTLSQSPDGNMDNLSRNMSMDSPARGLEQSLFPEITEGRRRIIQKILKAQSRLPPHASPGQKGFLLREVSRHLTRPSRRLAQLLAVGDARVVWDEMLAARSAMDEAVVTSNVSCMEVR